LLGLFRRKSLERPGYLLYGAAVAAARQPVFYAALGVADTLDGRFDMVGLHVFLVIDRLTGLPEPGPRLAQAVFDAMFNDMDVNLREMGVGDLSVGKRNRGMWEAFHGRAAAYRAALRQDDDAALVAALVRNVWRGAPPDDAVPARLAAAVRAAAAALADQGLADLARGQAHFPELAP
jgi:cytochrome b pre-mRNA-processing protein 3